MPSTPDPRPATAAAGASPAVEAARYALLRRLAPSLRHEAVAHLQPIAMIGGVLERRLAAPQPELPPLRDGIVRLVAAARASVQASLDLVAWLAPEPAASQPLDQGVAEGVALLRGSLGFRGFSLQDETAGVQVAVSRASLRQVLPASLLWLTDGAGPPAQVRLQAQALPPPGPVRLTLSLEPVEGTAPAVSEPGYRPLTRAELAALAQAEGVALQQDGDTLTLTLPRIG